MKVKKKGRVYPSLSSSPASYRDPDSVFKLFPVAILALAAALPPQDREVLAYMITRSIISTMNPSASQTHHQNQNQPKNKCKKGKVPVFQCGCFDCYTRFWHMWDSSPNRDLIHQVIEAFEEHLLQNEVSKKHCKASRKKDKVILVDTLQKDLLQPPARDSEILMVESEAENGVGDEQGREGEDIGSMGLGDDEVAAGNLEMEVVAVATGGAGGVSHKGLARKVLPDVVGLFNSRLWSLWGPSI
ncbi:hypothetical protein COLO4_06543 [Corchorus olitorius]|uniref:Uncharacterized protein n=1 Tax=Corchorus olitorius TaxID=93759 RepID=A0A1R3KMT3_9ROSI|nr:hypothetical protein COLO4_06543 [Corchorus olitorius]